MYVYEWKCMYDVYRRVELNCDRTLLLYSRQLVIIVNSIIDFNPPGCDNIVLTY